MPPKKKGNSYKFAPPLPEGTILQDIAKKNWKLGISIGKGGFGEIYSAQEEGAKGDKYPYVVKIEPHGNGPLFVEINFYIRHAKKNDVEAFKNANNLKTLGMPVYHGSGSHEYGGEKFRFLVMDKFGSDLYKLYIENNKKFPVDTVFKLANQIVDVLKYIHERGYAHADIKPANLLMGLGKDTQNKQVFLVDFGLASKYTLEKEFKPNPKKAHDGTIEYLSRDAHQGVQTRRGDMEILAYNMLHWFGCKLPWENNLKDPRKVQSSKEENMISASKILEACFESDPVPEAFDEFLTYLLKLGFNTEPDYNKIKGIFLKGIQEAGGKVNTALQFSEARTPLKRTRTPLANSRSNKAAKKNNAKDDGNVTPKIKTKKTAKKVNNSDEEMNAADNDDDDEEKVVTPKLPKNKQTKAGVRKNKKISNESDSENDREPPKKKRVNLKKAPEQAKNNKTSSDQELNDDAKNQAHSDTEHVTVRKKVNRKDNATKTNLKKDQAMSLTDLRDDDVAGYTDAMKEVMLKKRERVTKRKKPILSKVGEKDEDNEDMNGYNDEMKEVAAKRRPKEKTGTGVVSNAGGRTRNAKTPISYAEASDDD